MGGERFSPSSAPRSQGPSRPARPHAQPVPTTAQHSGGSPVRTTSPCSLVWLPPWMGEVHPQSTVQPPEGGGPGPGPGTPALHTRGWFDHGCVSATRPVSAGVNGEGVDVSGWTDGRMDGQTGG